MRNVCVWSSQLSVGIRVDGYLGGRQESGLCACGLLSWWLVGIRAVCGWSSQWSAGIRAVC